MHIIYTSYISMRVYVGMSSVKFIPLSFRFTHDLPLLTVLQLDGFGVAGLAVCVWASIVVSSILFNGLLVFALSTDFEIFVLPKQHIVCNEALGTIFVIQSSWCELEFFSNLL